MCVCLSHTKTMPPAPVQPPPPFQYIHKQKPEDMRPMPSSGRGEQQPQTGQQPTVRDVLTYVVSGLYLAAFPTLTFF